MELSAEYLREKLQRSLTGAAVSTWLHMEPGIAAEPEGDTWLTLCSALPIPTNTPQSATKG